MGASTMKSLFLITLMLIALLGSVADSQEQMQKKFPSNMASVYFYGFDVERITGIHEDEIKSLGCPYVIDRDVFLREINPNTSGLKYRGLDVRALVIFSQKESYFIDRQGVVSLNGREFLVDKNKFIKTIEQAGSCK
jgi:hypothetical protein